MARIFAYMPPLGFIAFCNFPKIQLSVQLVKLIGHKESLNWTPIIKTKHNDRIVHYGIRNMLSKIHNETKFPTSFFIWHNWLLVIKQNFVLLISNIFHFKLFQSWF